MSTSEKLTKFFAELIKLGQQPQYQGIGDWSGSPTRQLERLAADDNLDGFIEFMLSSTSNEFPLDGAQVRLYFRNRKTIDGKRIELSVGGIDRDRYPKEFYKDVTALIAKHGFERERSI